MAIICPKCKGQFHEQGELIWIEHLKKCQPELYEARKAAYEKKVNRMPERWE